MFSSRRFSIIGVLSLVFILTFTSFAFASDTAASQKNANYASSEIGISSYYWYHQIISEKPLYLKDAGSDTWYDYVTGTVDIKWNNLIPIYNSLNAQLQVSKDLTYEFTLVKTESCSSDSIIGTFNIKKNGVLVASNIRGQLYGLNQDIGQYFKFYSDDMNWHFSAYITDRVDGTINYPPVMTN
jgi:hypothetical protein